MNNTNLRTDENYSFYLFTRLREIVFPSEKPYDEQFDNDVELFEKFIDSEFNTYTMSLYDCIVEFLRKY